MNEKYTVRISDYTIRKDEYLIYGKLCEPEADGVFPLVVSGHGYNGSWEDWKHEWSCIIRRYAFRITGKKNTRQDV